MKKIILIILILNGGTIHSQDSILTMENLFPFIVKVDSLNIAYSKILKPAYYSIQQTNADYIRIITKDPDAFLDDLDNSVPPNELTSKYDNSVIDRNVLITKTKITTFKDEELITFQSYNINSGEGHNVQIPFDYDIYANTNQKGKYFYQHYCDKMAGSTRIDAFYIINDFESIKLNPKIASSIDYSNLIIGSEKLFFNKEPSVIPESEFNPIDSLLSFFNNSTKNPERKKDESLSDFRKRLYIWHENKEVISDSIFIVNKSYRNLIKQAISFADEYKTSNPFLEHLCDRYISKSAALNLMRLSSVEGRQSFDPSPINQHLRLCKTAAELSNWAVFIKSLIYIMNDNMNRSVDNSLVRASRKTYFSEIEKLPIDIEKLLTGLSLRISNPIEHHYWGASDRIGKSIANSNQTKNLVEAFFKVIQSSDIDQFNKLHFYNILLHVSYFSDNEEVKSQIQNGLKEYSKYLDNSIINRINNPHLELKNLLFRDSAELELHFEIEFSLIGNIYIAYTVGESWIGHFKPKGYNQNIFFSVIMEADTILNSIKKLTEEKDSLISIVLDHKIFNEFLQNDTCSITIHYIINRSYVEKKYCKQEIPIEIKMKYESMFDKAIMLDTNKGRKRANWIIFENGDALLTQMAEGFSIESHSFEDLLTLENEKRFGNSDFYSFKLINREGKIIELPTDKK